MYERRLKVLLGTFIAALVIIVARLGQLQLVRASYYRQRAAESLVLSPQQVPFVRGSILDRTGDVLVRDEACWDVKIDYTVLAADAGDASAMRRLVARAKRNRRYGSDLPDDAVARYLRAELDAMWSALASFSTVVGPVSVDELRTRGRDIYEKVQRIRAAVAARRGFDAPVAEEEQPAAVLTELDADAQIAAREHLGHFPWVHVEAASARRFVGEAEPFAHVIGRVGNVLAEHVADDPNAEDPFAKYQAGERVGITGIEYAAEPMLRGRRGQVTTDRDGHVIPGSTFEAEDGEDVTLTIHAGLQRRLYGLLGETVRSVPASSGGAIVVLDVDTRDVLALVSYPGYEPSRFREHYAALRDDTDRLPLRFRAVANQYPPGSTVKPLVCLAGLIGGKITLDTRETCTGYLFDDVRDAWRCWQIHGTRQRKAHGSIDVVEALIGSCNIFMYRLGEKLSVDGLCSVFDMVGFGKYSGLGLREEVAGINPTPGWLMDHKNMRVTPGTARLYAIGQGELSVTPVQVANLMATYASGRYKPLTLFRTDEANPEWVLPSTPEQLRAIQRGIYGVVNDPSGTAYAHAHFEQAGWALCGKTGSATAHPWPTAYRVPYEDAEGKEGVAIIRAGAAHVAIDRFVREHPQATFDPGDVEVASRWPPLPPDDGDHHAHAWFGGYLQRVGTDGEPDWFTPPKVAFAVLVEFGGSGGRVSGPVAQRVAATLLEVLGPALDVDTVVTAQRSGS